MKVHFLGTGAAGGVPLYGCDCVACRAAHVDPARVRRPCSALIEYDDTRLLIDAGLMDLHERFPPGALASILLTHFHVDHVQGLFHLRWGRGQPIDVHCPPDEDGCADLYRHPGLLAWRQCEAFAPFTVGTLTITPLPLNHSRPTFGYAIESERGHRFAYLTDTLGLPEMTSDFLRQWRVFDLAIDCSYPPREVPRNHNDWSLAHECARGIGARHTWLTHIGHGLDAWCMQTRPEMRDDVGLARDGQVHEVAGDTRR